MGELQSNRQWIVCSEMAGVEFTNGDQPGVRLTKAAAAQSRQPASASAAAEKTGRRKTPKVTDKKR